MLRLIRRNLVGFEATGLSNYGDQSLLYMKVYMDSRKNDNSNIVLSYFIDGDTVLSHIFG